MTKLLNFVVNIVYINTYICVYMNRRRRVDAKIAINGTALILVILRYAYSINKEEIQS